MVLRRILAFPPFQALALDRLGRTLTPLALVSVGYQLQLGKLRSNARELSAGLLHKLALGPALASALFVLGLHGSGTVMQVAVFEAAMRLQIGAAIGAMEHGLNLRPVSPMAGIGIPMSLLTAAAWSQLLWSV